MTTAFDLRAQKGEVGQPGVAGSTGVDGVFANNSPGGRLTLVSGQPMPTADTTGASAATIYYTPFLSSTITLYDGANWVSLIFFEASLSLTGLNTSQPYDIFGYLSAGSLTLEAVAWTSNSARATAIVAQNGVWVKNGSTTKRLLGTIQLQASGQSEDSVLRRFVFNQYNRVRRILRAVDATASWTYSTHTWRQANGTATNNQVSVVNGAVASPAIAEVEVHLLLVAASANSTATAAGIEREVAIGVDSTTAPHADCVYTACGGGGVSGDVRPSPAFAAIDHMMALGKHDFTRLERPVATGTTTWYGTGATLGVTGLSGYTLI